MVPSGVGHNDVLNGGYPVRTGEMRTHVGVHCDVPQDTGGDPTLEYTQYLTVVRVDRSQPTTYKVIEYDKSHPLRRKLLPHLSSTSLVIGCVSTVSYLNTTNVVEVNYFKDRFIF